ncbi:MAG: anaerobic ribonucleoside-triphosphate reductase activating protein, partial [Lachnospiraceae bacterium]|nr:anaerobic ribonucleoside-triphosphate reductase activating protein [Lachnospiraceae bacterium]
MNIQGLQKLTLLDYPDHMACTIFTGGCNFRCPFCHNGDLVLHSSVSQGVAPALSHDELFSFLEKRQGILDGVCITGGEPLLQPDLEEMIRQIRDLGFLVKLDTNGSFPQKLFHLLEQSLID